MQSASDAILEGWAAAMAENQRNADNARDAKVRAAYLDLVEGYRRLIETELSAQALFEAAIDVKKS